MKSKLIAIILLTSLICWAFPLTATGYTAPIKKESKVEEVKEPVNEPDNSKLETSQNVAKSLSADPKITPIKSKINPEPKGEYSGRHYSKEEVIQISKDYSEQYGISPETPICIAGKESGYNQFSKNKSSSASGVFQYLKGTWKATDEGKAGLSVFDADANVKAAIKYMAIHKNTRPWTVARVSGILCKSKFIE